MKTQRDTVRNKEIYFTREDEELCDLSIAQEGRCMQRGALLCILREEVSQLMLVFHVGKVQQDFSSCTYQTVLWFKRVSLKHFHTSATMTPQL